MTIRKPIYILLFTLITLLGSCSDDLKVPGNGNDDNGEIPIEFEFMLPEQTRALTGAKTSFTNGDVIHISGKFNLENGGTEIRYGALAYNTSSGWTAVTDSKLTWPNTAVSGVFTAYHIPTLNIAQGSIITNNDRNISLLQNVTLTSDPLFAETPESNPVNYGAGVKLQFSHLCAYLTLENLTPAYSQFSFSAENIKETATSPTNSNFNNAFYLQLNADNTLSFGFCQSPENQSRYTITCNTVKNSDNLNSGNVSFFLQPGYYEKFTVYYPTGETLTPFLNYQYSPLAEDETTPPMLNAGVSYTLNTVTSSGITITNPSEEENKPWPDDEPMDVDVDKFLTAISENKAYTENEYNILVKTDTGLKLNYNVDFKFYPYIWLENGSYPNVPTGEVFDGDNHTIYNLGCPLFNSVIGTVTNLGIDTFKANVVLNQYYNYNGNTYDFSRQGALCRTNTGTITKIRMTNVDLTAEVVTNNDGDNEANQDTENVGLIAGSNTGTIDNVRLGGNLSLEVNTSAQDTDGTNCTINMGGLVGQNADSGIINDIASLDTDNALQKISIVNTSKGESGAFYVGGVVGYNAGYIGPIGVPLIDIDCSTSQCTKSFIGLLTGEITTSTGSTSTIVGANVAGSAKAGTIYIYDNLDSGSYIGGIAGASVLPNGGNGISVTNCMVVAQLLDNSRASNPVAINCTGGCFGRIYEPFTVNNITLNIGSILYPGPQDGMNWFAGTFAGLSPTTQAWNWGRDGNRLAGNSSNVQAPVGSNTIY